LASPSSLIGSFGAVYHCGIESERFYERSFDSSQNKLARRSSRRAKQFELPALDIQPDIVKLNVFKLREQFGIINIFFYKIN